MHGCSRLLLATAVLVVLPWIRGQTVTCSTDRFCVTSDRLIQTPTDGIGILASCTYSATLICKSITFTALVANGTAVDFIPSPDILRNGTCDVPTASPFVAGPQVCGVGRRRSIQDSVSKIYYEAVPFTFKPSSSIPVSRFGRDSTSSVCFQIRGGATQRCLKVFINVSPTQPESTDSIFTVYAPRSLTIPIESGQWDATDQVNIVLSPDQNSPELPGQQWMGPSACTNVSANGYCLYTGTVKNWKRTLLYTASAAETGITYDIYIQALSQGYPLNPPSFGGMGCGSALGVCPAPRSSPGRLTVQVTLNVPQFQDVLAATAIPLYSRPGAITSPPEFADVGVAAGAALPAAYVNCPMRRIGFYATMIDSVQQLSFRLEEPSPRRPGAVSIAGHGFSLSTPRLYPIFAISDNGLDPNNIQTYWSYTTLSWTPGPAAAGKSFDLCILAAPPGGISSRRCVSVTVARCMACTRTGDTLKSIAAIYHTSWLQLWSTNYNAWAEASAYSLQQSNVSAWPNPKNPTELPPGILIRLGPVAIVRTKIDLPTFAARFHTSLNSLYATNPDLDPAQPAPLEYGQALCVLSEVCDL